MYKIYGTTMSEGVSIGKAVIINSAVNIHSFAVCEDKNKEKDKISKALSAAIAEQQKLIEIHIDSPKETKDILVAYLFMLKDPDLKAQLHQEIEKSNCTAQSAVKQVFDAMIFSLCTCDDEYIKSRGEDLSNVMNRLIDILGGKDSTLINTIEKGSIIVCATLSPSVLAAADLGNISGIITSQGGAASHTAIMARAAQIPAICCSQTDLAKIKEGTALIIDGGNGAIIIDPKEKTKASYEKIIKDISDTLGKEIIYKNTKGKTADGHNIPIEANIGSQKDMPLALEYGAEGIGLVRTEFMFTEREALPDINTQYDAYKRIVGLANGMPVVFRTLDAGGDKSVSQLYHQEENPFLGYRGIRILSEHRQVLADQIKALLMASAHGNITMLFPMISSIDEILEAKNLVSEVKSELKEIAQPYDENIKIGAMIEVPSAAILSDLIGAEVDLLSIGTNDLTQYTLAVDRGNHMVSYLFNNYHPAVLRLIQTTAQAGKKHNIPVCVCGEMASQPKMAGVLLGLGVTSLSVSPSMICHVRASLDKTTMAENIDLANSLLNCKTLSEVHSKLNF